MTQRFIFFIIMYSFTLVLYSQNPDYHGGNGTIIERTTEDGVKKTLRKHEQLVQIGDLADGKNLVVFDSYDPLKQQIIHKLELNDTINISQYYSIEYIENEKVLVWLKISAENIREGWILFHSGKANYEPYRNDSWSILDIIETGNKRWTVRKLEQSMAVWETMNVRDRPGLNGSKVIFQLVAPKSAYTQMNFEILAITEEKEMIDGRNDHWVKIKDERGRIGWMFAGYATIERGGPRYYFPENRIDFGLGYY